MKCWASRRMDRPLSAGEKRAASPRSPGETGTERDEAPKNPSSPSSGGDQISRTGMGPMGKVSVAHACSTAFPIERSAIFLRQHNLFMKNPGGCTIHGR